MTAAADVARATAKAVFLATSDDEHALDTERRRLQMKWKRAGKSVRTVIIPVGGERFDLFAFQTPETGRITR